MNRISFTDPVATGAPFRKTEGVVASSHFAQKTSDRCNRTGSEAVNANNSSTTSRFLR